MRQAEVNWKMIERRLRKSKVAHRPLNTYTRNYFITVVIVIGTRLRVFCIERSKFVVLSHHNLRCVCVCIWTFQGVIANTYDKNIKRITFQYDFNYKWWVLNGLCLQVADGVLWEENYVDDFQFLLLQNFNATGFRTHKLPRIVKSPYALPKNLN